MITVIVLYNLPPSIGFEECREHWGSGLSPKATQGK
jgi:hypothetical protein